MVDDRLKDLRGPSRREFLRWAGTVAALLGVDRARFLNVIGETAGTANADVAACASTNLAFSLVGGNGGISNIRLIAPHVKVANGGNANAPFHAIGKAVAADGYDKPFMYAPESPWKNGKWKWSAFMAGTNETHTATPQTAATVATGTSMLAAISAIATTANPSLVPAIAINPVNFGTAPGSPAVASVNNAAGLVDLFNSAASRALLQADQNAALAEAYYKAFLNLNAAANRSSTVKQYGVGKVAMNLLGKNLAEQLRPTPADEAIFGLAAGAPTNVTEIVRAMITAVKAFRLGLTSHVVAPFYRDDPHGLFAGGDAGATTKAQMMGKYFDGLLQFASASPDPSCSSKTLADRIIVTAHGDTPKSYNNRGGWPDGTTQNSNILMVMGNGFLRSGWFGDFDPAGNGSVAGWDRTTGAATPGAYNGADLGNSASAAALYAMARGDMRRVQDFYRGPALGDGVIVPQNL